MNASAGEPVEVRMPARVWAGIDAGVDNAVSLAAQRGDEQVMRFGRAIRAAGWAQVPWVDGKWPSMDQVISIRLTPAQWRFAAEDARARIPSYEGLGDDVSAQLCRDALAVIEGVGIL